MCVYSFNPLYILVLRLLRKLKKVREVYFTVKLPKHGFLNAFIFVEICPETFECLFSVRPSAQRLFSKMMNGLCIDRRVLCSFAASIPRRSVMALKRAHHVYTS